jgi:hypothetical protein
MHSSGLFEECDEEEKCGSDRSFYYFLFEKNNPLNR